MSYLIDGMKYRAKRLGYEVYNQLSTSGFATHVDPTNQAIDVEDVYNRVCGRRQRHVLKHPFYVKHILQ